MTCEEFKLIYHHYSPQDVSQVERIRMIEHTQECEDCFKFITEEIKIIQNLDFSMLNLAKMDGQIV